MMNVTFDAVQSSYSIKCLAGTGLTAQSGHFLAIRLLQPYGHHPLGVRPEGLKEWGGVG